MVICAKSDHTIPPTPGCVIISQSRPPGSSGGNHGEEKEKRGKTFSRKQHRRGGKMLLNKKSVFFFLFVAIHSRSLGCENAAPGSIVWPLFLQGQAESEKRVSEEKGQFVDVC